MNKFAKFIGDDEYLIEGMTYLIDIRNSDDASIAALCVTIGDRWSVIYGNYNDFKEEWKLI